METKKAALGFGSLVHLAYAPARDRRKKLPGPYFDAGLLGLLIVLGVAYFV